jgi:hypothetical protein
MGLVPFWCVWFVCLLFVCLVFVRLCAGIRIPIGTGPTKNLLADLAQEVPGERDVAFAVR